MEEKRKAGAVAVFGPLVVTAWRSGSSRSTYL
jgi:hypothetical protein